MRAETDEQTLNRRAFLGAAGAALATAPAAAQLPQTPVPPSPPPPPAQPAAPFSNWPAIRAMFPLATDHIDMSAMLITSHPSAVSAAIERHRRALDANPITYLETNNRRLQNAGREAIGNYLGMTGSDVALTDSTTMGVALAYQGLRMVRGQEIVTTDADYYVTHESLRLLAEKTGARVRRIALGDDATTLSADALAARIVSQVGPATRVLALTWVHSSTGLKLPIRRIADMLRARQGGIETLICVDGVHGFGNQNVNFGDLGADLLMAGCHKWLFGPRGTGMIAGSQRGWAALSPTIPTFLDSDAYGRWFRDEPSPGTTAAMVSPGGFKAFEHLWAIPDAFAIHRMVGKPAIAARTAELAAQLKQGLAAIPGVTVKTPLSPELSAGIVSFTIAEQSPAATVDALRYRHIIGSVAPYRTPYARLTPSIRNSQREIEFAIDAVRTIAAT